MSPCPVRLSSRLKGLIDLLHVCVTVFNYVYVTIEKEKASLMPESMQ